MRKPYWLALALVIVIGLAPVWLRPKDPRVLPASAVNASENYSNILPGDYVGPKACARCHEQKFALWSKHSHSRMNQMAEENTVLGDFSGTVLKFADASVRFSRSGGKFLVCVERGGEPLRRYRVTRTVGSRFEQFYIGVQEEGPEPKGHPVYNEHMLPFAYWFKIQRWLPKNYFDADGPEELKDGIPVVEGIDKLRDVRVYTQVCMNCHNTLPYAYRIFHDEFCGFPDATVAAAIEPLSPVLSAIVPVEPNVQSFFTLNGRLDPDKDLVTLGISCESCHFGGREHALNEQAIRFTPTSRYVQLKPRDPSRSVTGSRKDPATLTGICAQCHSGNGKLFPNGAGVSNSREALDLHRGACASQIRCVSCHEPHTAGVPSGGPVNPKHLSVCVGCHTQYKAPSEAAAHSRHPSTAGVNCLDCHMPRYTQGVDELVRTHRITVPVEESMVSKGSANACNLCHLDRSVRWTLQELERGWQRRLGAKEQWAGAYGGSLDAPAGEVWLKGEDTSMRLVATQSYARSPLGRAKLPDLLRALNDPEPINRVFATFAVERLTGKRLDPAVVDITAPPAHRARQIDGLLSGHWPSGDQ